MTAESKSCEPTKLLKIPSGYAAFLVTATDLQAVRRRSSFFLVQCGPVLSRKSQNKADIHRDVSGGSFVAKSRLFPHKLDGEASGGWWRSGALSARNGTGGGGVGRNHRNAQELVTRYPMPLQEVE